MSVSGSTIYYEPCAIEYEVTGVDNNVSSDDLVLPNGKIKVYAQQNDRTNTITENGVLFSGTHRIGLLIELLEVA